MATPDGALRLVDAQDAGPSAVGVNREFLLQALAAERNDQLSLELGGPISPLTIRGGATPHGLSLLMRVQLQTA